MLSLLLPSKISGIQFSDLRDTVTFYSDDLAELATVEGEYYIWKQICNKQSKYSVISSALDALCDYPSKKDHLPIIWTLLTI